jgi:molybdenum cofactor cytidylyltransferase
MISAIVLAAGEGRRMGQLKQLLPWGTSTILEQVIKNVRASKVDEIVLVVGYRAGDVLENISLSGIKVKVNYQYFQGMSSSIQVGLQAINPETQAVLLVLGDLPLVTHEIINRIIEAYRNHKDKKGIILPVHKGMRGHPVIIDLKYREEIMQLRGDIGCRQIIDAHSQDVLSLEMPTPAILHDIDEPSDLDKCIK